MGKSVLCLLLLGASALAQFALSQPVLAQDSAQSLADIKVELSALMSEFTALKQELVLTGAATSGSAGGNALQRLDTIEAELVRLTSKTEDVELKVNRVISDGTNRVGDLEFRLCEATEGCDIAALPDTPPLGGSAPAPVFVDPVAPTTGPELAIGEQADFDRAKEVLATGDFRTAANLFTTYAQSYPGGPLMQEAQFLRGEALNQLGETSNAARAYLEAFSGAPDGTLAGQSLLKLGQALGDLGQIPEACVTLGEVGTRYPGSIDATTAQVSMQGLGCQ
jgi:tol-pal system protein YbgF